MGPCTTGVQHAWRPEEGAGAPGAGATDGVSHQAVARD